MKTPELVLKWADMCELEANKEDVCGRHKCATLLRAWAGSLRQAHANYIKRLEGGL